MKNTTLLLLLAMSTISLKNIDVSSSMINSENNSLLIETNFGKVYLFDKATTKKYFRTKKNKDLKYLNYWDLEPCVINELLGRFNEYTKTELIESKIITSEVIVWQFFPYINLKGELIVSVTISMFDEEKYKEYESHLSQHYRSIFGDTDYYLSFYFNYSNNKYL
jgi:hypothetical protein